MTVTNTDEDYELPTRCVRCASESTLALCTTCIEEVAAWYSVQDDGLTMTELDHLVMKEVVSRQYHLIERELNVIDAS